MPGTRRYSDRQLQDAVSASRSWRETLRRLGLVATSSSAIRSARTRANELGIEYSHFTGGRRWSDRDLIAAVRESSTWQEVVDRLGLRGGSALPFVRRHAVRLNADTSHLDGYRSPSAVPPFANLEVDIANLHRAGSQMAAAWFTMCGCDVSWPLEPCRYDLVVVRGQTMRRVQVKTTTTRNDNGAWQVSVSAHGRHEQRVYTPEEIDDFFIIDGDLNFYLIPIDAMRGAHAIRLSAYEEYRVRGSAPSLVDI